ncbi:MAG: hypothetical protein LBN32_00185 [Helicobacteraceae bacterium]|jgi:hypothetical protein|nr:hypothetical protein [Helicobacteraceae bacterium]
MEEEIQLRHSGLGIASFVLSIVDLVAFMVLLVFAAIVGTSLPSNAADAQALLMLIGVMYFAVLLVAIVAIGLGIAGVCQRARKVFGILGLTFSIGIMLFAIFVMLLGLANGG